jgi:hypothetical protein
VSIIATTTNESISSLYFLSHMTPSNTMILLHLCRGENVQLQSIPTTLVIVNSVEERFSLPSDSDIQCVNRSTEYPPQEQQSLSEIVSKIDLLNDFISHEMPARDHLRVHCKVRCYYN